MNFAFKLTAIIVSSAVLQGCGSVGGFDINRLKEKVTMLFSDEIKAVEPPSEMGLSRYNNISIKSNTDSDNTTVTAIKTQFEKSKIGNDPYFNNVNYDDGTKTLDESYAIFSLKIEEPTLKTFSIKEKRFKCPGDGMFRSCDSSEAVYYTVNCSKTVATAIGSYLITDSSGKKVISKNTFESSEEDTTCSDSASLKKSFEYLSFHASQNAGDKLAEKFIPKIIERPNDLIKKDKNLAQSDQTLMEKAFEYASEGKIVKAKLTYEKLYNISPKISSLTYNRAYCEHILGNYDIASKLFNQYLALESEPNSDAQKYLDEANSWLSKGISQVTHKSTVL